MADDVRETIRAAQAAELRGDTAGAIALLKQAAAQYRAQGKRSRALQMLRQALRLDDSRMDVAEELHRLESLPDATLSPDAEQAAREAESVHAQSLLTEQTLEALALAAADETLDAAGLERALESAASRLSGEDAEDLERALASAAGLLPDLDAGPRPPARGQRLVERGPSRADPAIDAWCSFCCRPFAEVGELIAGPAGAFICVSCARESTALLGSQPVPHAPAREPLPAPRELVGQGTAQTLLERALAQGARRILVLGAEGSGKSTWMRSLVGAGRAVTGDAARPEAPFPGALLVLEDVDRLAPPVQEALATWLEAQPAPGVVLTARGDAAPPVLTLKEGALRLPVHTDEALAQATGGTLTPRLLRCVGPVLWLARPDAALLEQVARARLQEQEGLQLPEAALRALALQAADSGGAGHALESLLGRLVTGSWTLEAAAAPRPRVRRRKRKA
jgi:hypothetical protein